MRSASGVASSAEDGQRRNRPRLPLTGQKSTPLDWIRNHGKAKACTKDLLCRRRGSRGRRRQENLFTYRVLYAQTVGLGSPRGLKQKKGFAQRNAGDLELIGLPTL